MQVVAGGPVDHLLRVEDLDVGGVVFAQQAAVSQLLPAHVLAEEAGVGSLAARVRQAPSVRHTADQ